MMSEENETDFSEWEQASTKKMLSFSFGYLLVFFMGGQFNVYVFYYYEVEIGLPVVMLGFAFIIFAVWNMINDPLVGFLTDKPFKWTKKWGMRFPWMVLGVIPYIICWYFLFAAPEALVENSDPWPIFWYFVIMACLLDTFYSLFTTHINAAFTTHFRTDAERRKAQLINNTIPQVLQLFIGFTVPLIYIYGNRNSMILAQTIVVLLMFVAMLIMIPGVRESNELKERFLRGYEKQKRDPYFKSLKLAFGRRNFTSTLIVYMLLSFGAIIYAASGVYFFKDILGIPYSYAIFTGLAGFVGFVGSVPFWVWMCKKIGHGNVMKLSLFLITLVYLPVLWMTTLIEAIIYGFFGGIASAAFWTPLGPVTADVYDESTISTGKHQEAMYEGIRTLFNRLGFVFVGIVLPIVHISTGYNPDPHGTQTPLAIWGIRIHMGLIPSLLALISFVVMIKWYDLAGEKQKALKIRLKEMNL